MGVWNTIRTTVLGAAVVLSMAPTVLADTGMGDARMTVPSTTLSKASRLEAPIVRVAAKRGRLEQRWRYERNQYSTMIERYASEYGLPAELAHAVIEIESTFRPNVRGAAGEVGLMQIKPATARMMGFRGSTRALFDPETNIKFGMRYLAKAHELGGEKGVCGTILKYNAGHGAKRMNPISSRYCDKVKAVFARNDKNWLAGSAPTYASLDAIALAPLPRFRD